MPASICKTLQRMILLIIVAAALHMCKDDYGNVGNTSERGAQNMGTGKEGELYNSSSRPIAQGTFLTPSVC